MPAHVLIVDSIAANRILLKVKLSGAFANIEQAASAGEALDLIKSDAPDLLVLGGDFVDMTATELCRLIKQDPNNAAMSVLLVHGDGTRETRLAALRAGADDAFAMPVTTDALLARIRSLMRTRASVEDLRLREGTARIPGLAEASSRFEMPSSVLIATDRKADGVLWTKALRKMVPYVLRHQPLQDIMRCMSQFTAPDAIVIELNIAAPEEALRFLAEIRARSATRQAAVLVVLDEADDTARINALDLGANDVLADGFDPEEACLRLDTMLKRKRLTDRLHLRVEEGLAAAVTDPLTGLFNRRYALPQLTKVAHRAQNQHGTFPGDFAVMLADLDHFKEVNDQYGHAAGDIVLTEIARRMRSALSQADLIARIGGEEFLIVVQAIDAENAAKVAQRLCEVVRGEPVYLRGRDIQIPVTVSIGVAMGSDLLSAQSCNAAKPNSGLRSGARNGAQDGLATALIDRADQALYGAKAHGRDQFTLSSSAA